MNKLINKKSFDFTTNKLNSLSREPKSIKSKPQKFSDTGCKNLFLYRYRAGRMAFYIRYNETISKGKYRKKEIYLSDFEPYGPADQVENIRIEVNQRNKSRKDEAPLIHDPLFSSVILKFIKEGLEGLRVKYITQRKGFMEKYNPKHKRQIKTMLLNMVLHRTKKAELLQRLERAITADTQFIKDKRISKITTDDIDLLMQRLSSTPRQANLLKSHLSIVFKWSMIQGFCSHNPTEKVGTFQTKKAEKITLDDFRARKLINYCHTTMYVKPHCRALIIALHCSGIRAEHLFGLRWQRPQSKTEYEESRGYVDLENKFIHIHKSKKDDELTQHFDEDTEKALTKLNELIRCNEQFTIYARSPWVFPKITLPMEAANYDSYKKAIKAIYSKPNLNLPEGYKNKFARKTAGTFIGANYGMDRGAAYLDNTKEVFKKNYFNEDKIKLKGIKLYDVEAADVVKNEVIAIKGGKK